MQWEFACEASAERGCCNSCVSKPCDNRLPVPKDLLCLTSAVLLLLIVNALMSHQLSNTPLPQPCNQLDEGIARLMTT